jgi:YD repeat-containing protein
MGRLIAHPEGENHSPKIAKVEQALADVLAMHASAIATDVGVAKVQYDYSSSGRLSAIVVQEDGSEAYYDLSIVLEPRK